MKASSIDSWIWALIYGGLLIAGLGVAVQRGGLALGWVLLAVGILAAAAGVALIFVRARIP